MVLRIKDGGRDMEQNLRNIGHSTLHPMDCFSFDDPSRSSATDYSDAMQITDVYGKQYSESGSDSN